MEEKIITKKAVVIGGSAGSLPVFITILNALPADLNAPLILIIHRNNDPDSGLTDILKRSSPLPVKEAEDKELILSSTIYIAPAGYHLLIEKNFSFSLDSSEKINFSRPSIDVTFQTAAEAFGRSLMAILLSGANDDGATGFKEIRDNGGILIAQDPNEATTPFMPQNVINKKLADRIIPAAAIADAIIQFSSLR